MDLENTFYLSPDATQPLYEIKDNQNFILGGLIDRTVVKYASLERANHLKLKSYRLPIEEECSGLIIKKALTSNQVAELLL